MYQGTARAFGKCGEQRIPGVAIAAGAFYLNELMIEQRSRGLFRYRLGEALFAEANHRSERMGESAEVAPLLF
jgi:hypothetical protein